MVRAFIGEPRDAKGNALTCTYCDRRARERIGPTREPLCARHDPGGALKPEELRESCSLDIADRGGETLEEAAAAMNITRERLRQIEVSAFQKLRTAECFLPSLNDFEHHHRSLPVIDTRQVDDTEVAPYKPSHTPATEAARHAELAEIFSAEASARSTR